jgi:nucleoside-diphosphate-sugar epimerase
MSHTVLGSNGFIGKELVKSLRDAGAVVHAPERHEVAALGANRKDRNFGHVFYCIGLTANFRTRPFDTVQAHVCILREFLENARFETFTYLSSTRVYEGANSTSEMADLKVSPGDPGHLYNLSKLMGESLCHARRAHAKVVRLSNVYGAAMPQQNFLSQVLRESRESGRVQFLTAPSSSKDYVNIRDVVRWLPLIATQGKHSVYNVATGQNTSNSRIGELLEQRGVGVGFSTEAPEWSFPLIDTRRLSEEFGPPTSSLAEDFDYLYSQLEPMQPALHKPA